MMIKDKIFSSVLSQIVFMFVSGFIGIALIPITLTMLGKLTYGAFELVLSLIMFEVFLEFGLGSTLVKFIPEYRETEESLRKFIWSYFYIKMGISLLVALIILVVGYNFDVYFNLDGIVEIDDIKLSVYIYALGVLFTSIASLLSNILRGLIYFGYANIARTVALILFFIAMYIYYLEYETKYNMIGIALIWFILKPSLSIICSLIVFYYLRFLKILIPAKYNHNHLRRTFKYMFGMSYITAIAQLYNRLPKIILGVISGPIHVLYWGLMEKIKEPILQLQSAALRPLVPIFSSTSYSGGFQQSTIFQAVRLQYFFITVLTAGIIVHLDTVILLWIGPEYNEVSGLTKILFLPMLFPNAGVLLMYYYSQGKTKINSFYISINSIISLSAATAGIIYGDIFIFVWAISFITIVATIVSIFAYLHEYKISIIAYIGQTIMRPVASVIIYFTIYEVILAYFESSIFGLFLSFMTSGFIVVLLFFIIMHPDDIRQAKTLLSKFTGAG